MKTIESFTIDHTRLKRGIYVSRRDNVGEQTITTFDLRMKEPNNEPALSSASAHTIEHIGATFLRNHETYGSRVLYFGPMGCLTGFYLLLNGDLISQEIVPLMNELFQHTAEFLGDIPGATAVQCGNFTLMDLDEAKKDSERFYFEVLTGIDTENLVYPK